MDAITGTLIHGGKVNKSESKINEWTETRGVECGQAEEKQCDGDDPNNDMTFVGVVGVINGVLKSLAKGEEGDERENGSNHQSDIELKIDHSTRCCKVKSEQASDKSPSLRDILDTEENP